MNYRANIFSMRDRTTYLKRVAEIKQAKKNRWCSEHPTSYWGKMDNGEWFERCSGGFKANQECRIGEDE